MKPIINLRADGNEKIGLGHVYRMIALSEILENEFECIFIIKNPDEFTVNLIKANNCKLQILTDLDIDVPEVNSNLNEPLKPDDILILDGYHFNTLFQQSIKTNIRCKLICVDDIFNYYMLTNMIINHTGGIKATDYNVSPDTRLLLGPEYALLRKKFYNLKLRTKNPKKIENIFLNFGGADPDNNTCNVIKELIASSFSPKQINVVIGSAYQNVSELHNLVNGHPFINVYKDLSSSHMLKIMKLSDTAICSASTVSYEYSSVGGLLFIIPTAKNQLLLFNFLVAEKIAIPYTDFNKTCSGNNISDIRDQLIKKQKKHFDGLAGKRICKEINKLYIKDNLTLRKAIAEDVGQYFKWANDLEVRKYSFNSDSISYDTHCAWFNSHLHAKDSCFYIFTTFENVPIASIRYKIQDNEAVLSYLIDERFRGIGFGKTVLEKGTQKFFEENNSVEKVIAFVKDKNIPSINAFFATGFEEVEYSKKHIRCFSKKNKSWVTA